MTAKAWYWTGLGILALSIASSSAGRCWMQKTSGVIGELRAKTVPYMAMAEMAMGRTQAGLGHMQAAQARLEAQAAQLQAAQAQLAANQASLEVLRTQPQLKHLNVLADYPGVPDRVIDVPQVTVGPDRIVVHSRHGVVVCPRKPMNIPVIDVPTPRISVMQNPI